MNIITKNDGKQKHQSCESSIDEFVATEDWHITISATGYSSTEHESRESLKESLKFLVEKLEETISKLEEE